MFFTTKSFIALGALVSLAAIPRVRSANIPVTVGGTGIIAYTPNFVTANIGDVVVFTFMQKNHTVTQSSLAAPCTPLEGGFDSGFVPVPATTTNGFPEASFPVTDTNPVWVYCRQTGHCAEGMVFAINPGTKFAAFQGAANGSSSTGSTGTSASSAAGGGAITATAPPSTTTAAAASGTGIVSVTAVVSESGQAITTTYGSYPGSAAPTAPVSNDHVILVGGSGTLTYSPANITAQVGDTVTFQFMSKNHTATQSSFPAPCQKLASTSTSGQIGFDSGFMPVASNASQFPSFTIQINDTAPIWTYCRQTGHCGEGMVFSINAVETSANTFEAFQAAAIRINGTAASASGTASGSASNPSASSGAISNFATSGFAVALFGAVVGMML